MNRNLTESVAALGLDGRAAYRLARNSLEAAFLDVVERRRLVERLDAFVAAFRERG